VVGQLKIAFKEAYGDIEDAAIRKITGSVDRRGSLILSFRNDALPKIAVTITSFQRGEKKVRWLPGSGQSVLCPFTEDQGTGFISRRS